MKLTKELKERIIFCIGWAERAAGGVSDSHGGDRLPKRAGREHLTRAEEYGELLQEIEQLEVEDG